MQRVYPPRARVSSLYSYLKRFLEAELQARDVALRDRGNGRPYDFFTTTGDWCLNAYEREVALVTQGDGLWWSLEIPETVCRPRATGPGRKPADYEVVLEGELVFPLKGRGPPVMVTGGLDVVVRPWAAPPP
ncbi:MAG: hypothetical protein AAF447_11110 [Myxococcota bacterium]